MLLESLFVISFITSSGRFRELDSRNVILFHIKIFDRNVKETPLVRCFIKVTTRLTRCFIKVTTQLRVIRRKNRVH